MTQHKFGYHQCGSVYSTAHSTLQHLSLLDLRIFSGFDLDAGRGILVKLGRMSGRTESTVLDTHPAGPERLAAWDLAAAEIRSGSPMPRKR